MKTIFTLALMTGVSLGLQAQDLPTPVFSLDFEGAASVADFGGEQVGEGELRTSSLKNFGTYYQNKPSETSKTSHGNYLIVPTQGFIEAQKENSEQVTITLWVNGTVANEHPVDHYYSTLVSAYNSTSSYKAFSWPMFSARARGTLQINCAGWSDFTGAEHVNGAVIENNDWIKNNAGENFDDNWHFVAIVINGQDYKFYIDGSVVNEWVTNDTQGSNNYKFTTVMQQLDQIYLGDCGPFFQDEDPAYAFDDVNIYASALSVYELELIQKVKMGDMDEDELLEVAKSKFYNAAAALTNYASEIAVNGFTTLAGRLNDSSIELEPEDGTIDDYNEATSKAQELLAETKGIVELYNEVAARAEQYDLFADATRYPGYQAFVKVIAEGLASMANPSDTAPIEQSRALFEQAKTAYLFSQELPADGTGINVSMMIQNPWFCNLDAQPTFDGNTYTFPYASDHSYTENTTPSDANHGSWVNGNSFPVDDARVNWTVGRICWNNWHNKATVGTLDVHQELAQLPAGYYTVTADWVTNAATTTQHTYATVNGVTKVSPYLDYQGWDSQTWTSLTTDKILVGEDGLLTIGAESSTIGQSYVGWFCVTNFVLTYYGTEISLTEDLNAKLAEAGEAVAGLQLAGDINNARSEIQKIVSSSSSDYDKITSLTNLIQTIGKWAEAEAGFDVISNMAEMAANETDMGMKAVFEAQIESMKKEWAGEDLTVSGFPALQDAFNQLVCYAEIVPTARKWNSTLVESQLAGLLAGSRDAATVSTLAEALRSELKADILSKASADEPLDITFAIKNHAFQTNNNCSWEGSTPAVSYNEAEFYNTNFDIHQTITGLPAGKYRIMVQGFYRNGSNESALGSYPDSYTANARLYAGEAMAGLRSWASDPFIGEDCYADDDFTSTYLEYYPNSMAGGSLYFAGGHYTGNYADVAIEEGADLTVGIRKDATINADWTLFDNFSLYYLGEVQQADTAYYEPICGNEGLDDPFWTEFSDNYTLKEGNTANFSFVNRSDAVNNWDNWILVAANSPLGTDGYAEFFVLRADNYGWGNCYDGSLLTNDFNWNTFASDMNGAFVDMFVTYKNGTVSMAATITTLAEIAGEHVTYNYGFTAHGVTGEEITLFFTEEHAQLIDGQPTGMEQLHSHPARPEADGAIYNLHGQRIATPERNTIYIKHGKKYMW